MCSACITSSPAGVEERGRAVVALLDVGRVGGADQRRAHLVAGGPQPADQHLQGDRVEPTHSAVPFPRISWVWNRATIVPASSTVGRPAGRQDQGRLRQLEDDRALGLGAGRGLAAQDRRSRPTRRRSEPGGCSSSRLAGGRGHGPRLGPGDDQRQADVDEDDLALGVAMAVALLVGCARSARCSSAGSGSSRPGDRQLEGLAGVAHLVDDLGARLADAGAGGGDQLVDRGGDPLGAQLGCRSASPCGRCRGGARRRRGRGPRGRRWPAGRGSSRSRARRRSPPRASGRRRRTAAGRSRGGRCRARP